MNDSPARPGYQRIGWTSVGLTGEVPDFLPNPRHREGLSDIDLYLQQVTEWGDASRTPGGSSTGADSCSGRWAARPSDPTGGSPDAIKP